MAWTTLVLRKTELKRSHNDYQMHDLQISREKRQMARRYSYEQVIANNDQNSELRDFKNAYTQSRDYYNDKIDAIRKAVRDANDNSDNDSDDNSNENNSNVSTATYTDSDGKTIADYQREMDEAKELYQEDVNEAKTYWEDELAMIEEEANDYETQLDQEQVEIEAQMEAISAEIDAVSEAISQEVQSSTIKLS